MTDAELGKLSILGLAHVGDAVYELLVRTLLAERGIATVVQLHRELSLIHILKLALMSILNSSYGITEEDFVSAELCAVPAFDVRDIGLDRSLIGAYGHDDRVCAYAELKAIFDVKDPEQTLSLIHICSPARATTSPKYWLQSASWTPRRTANPCSAPWMRSCAARTR